MDPGRKDWQQLPGLDGWMLSVALDRDNGESLQSLILDPTLVWQPLPGGIQAGLQAGCTPGEPRLVLQCGQGDLAGGLQGLLRQPCLSEPAAAALAAAILTAHQSLRFGQGQVARAPAVMAGLNAWSPQEPLSSQDWLLQAGQASPIGVADPVDRALAWLDLAASLWDPDQRSFLANVVPGRRAAAFLGNLAGAWCALKPVQVVMAAGATVRLSGPERWTAWSQVLEWERGHIRRSVLRYLTAYQVACRVRRLPEGCSCSRSPGFDRAAVCLAEALAADHGFPGLRGSARVDLPGGLLPASWNVTSLRVAAGGNGLWVALETAEQPWLSLWWHAGDPLGRSWVVPPDSRLLLSLVLAALWTDLRSGLTGAEEGGRRTLRGRLRWASTLDRAAVRGHLRRLPPGSRPGRAARREAAVRHVDLPPGTTYVRPFRRMVRTGGLDRLRTLLQSYPEHRGGTLPGYGSTLPWSGEEFGMVLEPDRGMRDNGRKSGIVFPGGG